jgi:COP9 signalosome complex subunit 2
VPRLKELYGKAVRLQNNVPHPRTLGIIQECGGKMYMSERQ